MKKFYFVCGLLSLIGFNASSQDPVFFNTNQSLIYLNPSFAGSNGNIRNQFSYRNQWPLLSHSLRTYVNSFDAYIKPMRGGIAVTAFQDDQRHGTLKSNMVALSYAQYLSFLDGELKIIPSVQFSYGQRSLDLDNLHFGDAIDHRYGSVWNSTVTRPTASKYYFDFSSGLMVNYKNKLYVGSSMFHINQPDIGLWGPLKMPYAFNLHASYYLSLTEQTRLQFFYRGSTQSNFYTHLLSLNLISYNHLITGVGIRSSDELFVNAGYRSNYFSLVVGYDMTFSKLAGNTAGAWEVNASFNLRNKDQRRTLTTFETW